MAPPKIKGNSSDRIGSVAGKLAAPKPAAAAKAKAAETNKAKPKGKAKNAKQAAVANVDDEDECNEYASLVFRDGAGNDSEG